MGDYSPALAHREASLVEVPIDLGHGHNIVGLRLRASNSSSAPSAPVCALARSRGRGVPTLLLPRHLVRHHQHGAIPLTPAARRPHVAPRNYRLAAHYRK